MTEDHPFNNRNFYGATKIAGEAMCKAYFDRYGLNYVGLRYMNVYGPGQDQNAAYSGVIPIMLNHIDAGKEPNINGDGTQAYDFIYVEDAARCNISAMQSKEVDEFYNAGTEVQTSIYDLCEKIKVLKKSNLKVNYNPYKDDDVRQFVQNRIGSNDKAFKQLGFKHKYDLEDGLKKLIEWRKKKLNIPIAKTEFNDEDFQAQLKPLESGWIVQGPYVEEFENKWNSFLGLNILLLLHLVLHRYTCHL